MRFTKMHGAGNDFVVLDGHVEDREWSRLAITLCDRHHGVGADGVLVLLPSGEADFRMRIFNADGSEANTCGNGMRCLVKYFVETRGNAARARRVSVETLSGVREAQVVVTRGRIKSVKIGMGQPEFGAADIPARLDRAPGRVVDIKSMIECEVAVAGVPLTIDLMSLGNPHAVHFVRHSVSTFDLARFGKALQQHKMFPAGVNFEVARVVSPRRIEARVWEQGVGETLACGSGACAITVAARLHGYVGERAGIALPGGRLEVEWDEGREVYLSGPAETVFVGDWPDSGRDEGALNRCGDAIGRDSADAEREVTS